METKDYFIIIEVTQVEFFVKKELPRILELLQARKEKVIDFYLKQEIPSFRFFWQKKVPPIFLSREEATERAEADIYAWEDDCGVSLSFEKDVEGVLDASLVLKLVSSYCALNEYRSIVEEIGRITKANKALGKNVVELKGDFAKKVIDFYANRKA